MYVQLQQAAMVRIYILLTGEKEKICMAHAKNSMCSCMPFNLKDLSIYICASTHAWVIQWNISSILADLVVLYGRISVG
jgi:hypothetical protein